MATRRTKLLSCAAHKTRHSNELKKKLAAMLREAKELAWVASKMFAASERINHG